MIKENTQPYIGITQRLTVPQDRLQSAALGMGLLLTGAGLGAGMFGASMFTLGYTASTLYRTVQPYIDARGSYAILWVTVVVPILIIWQRNSDPPVDIPDEPQPPTEGDPVPPPEW